MTKLMSEQAIRELRDILKKEIKSKTIDIMTDEEISYIGFFFLEVYVQSLHIRENL
jgi:hypothetical protein